MHIQRCICWCVIVCAKTGFFRRPNHVINQLPVPCLQNTEISLPRNTHFVAHFAQDITCPQGKNIESISWSMQIRHVIASMIRLITSVSICFFRSSSASLAAVTSFKFSGNFSIVSLTVVSSSTPSSKDLAIGIPRLCSTRLA